MNYQIILREIDNYKELLKSFKYDEVYKWEALKNFHDNWHIDAEMFKEMYDKSFSHKSTNNLWANIHWFPKGVMMRFIDHDKEKVRSMFKELFDEEELIDKRIERFVFHCDKMRDEIYEYDKKMISHFHDGQRMVSLYLAFRFPDKYAIYKYTEFKTFMEIVKATNIPQTGEYERFFKIVRIIYTYLTRDADLLKLHYHLLNDDCYKGETLILAQDFIFRTARRYMN